MSKTIGGTAGESANSIIQTSDGWSNYSGHTFSYGAGDADIFLV